MRSHLLAVRKLASQANNVSSNLSEITNLPRQLIIGKGLYKARDLYRQSYQLWYYLLTGSGNLPFKPEIGVRVPIVLPKVLCMDSFLVSQLPPAVNARHRQAAIDMWHSGNRPCKNKLKQSNETRFKPVQLSWQSNGLIFHRS